MRNIYNHKTMFFFLAITVLFYIGCGSEESPSVTDEAPVVDLGMRQDMSTLVDMGMLTDMNTVVVDIGQDAGVLEDMTEDLGQPDMFEDMRTDMAQDMSPDMQVDMMMKPERVTIEYDVGDGGAKTCNDICAENQLVCAPQKSPFGFDEEFAGFSDYGESWKINGFVTCDSLPEEMTGDPQTGQNIPLTRIRCYCKEEQE